MTAGYAAWMWEPYRAEQVPFSLLLLLLPPTVWSWVVLVPIRTYTLLEMSSGNLALGNIFLLWFAGK